MNNHNLSLVSRRSFMISADFGVAAVAFAPHLLFPQNRQGIVSAIIDEAAKATVTTNPVRRNISVLECSGGNIAVLTGKDGQASY